MTRVVIICAGAHGCNAVEMFRGRPDTDIVGFLDDRTAPEGVMGLRVLGPVHTMDAVRGQADAAFVGLGNIRFQLERRRFFEQAEALGFDMISAVHSHAFISPSARCGSGLFMAPFSAIHARSRVGRNVSIYGGSIIEHDIEVGDHVFVGPGVHTAGEVVVEEGAYVSIGAKLGSGVRIGRNSIIAAGAVVMRDVPESTVVMGIPARAVATVEEWRRRAGAFDPERLGRFEGGWKQSE